MAQSSSVAVLQRAESASPRLVFPFRSESAEVFEWAMRAVPGSWRPKYYLALIRWSRNDLPRARALLDECGSTPDFAAFYAARSKAFEAVSRERALADLLRAAERDPKEWRYGKLIAERYLDDRVYDRALEVASRYYKQAPDSYILGMLFAKSLLRVGRLADAEAMLARVDVLPYEGATDGRALYREIQLLLGAQALREGRTAEALRRVAARPAVAREPRSGEALSGGCGRTPRGLAGSGMSRQSGPVRRGGGAARPRREARRATRLHGALAGVRRDARRSADSGGLEIVGARRCRPGRRLGSAAAARLAELPGSGRRSTIHPDNPAAGRG